MTVVVCTGKVIYFRIIGQGFLLIKKNTLYLWELLDYINGF